MQTKYNPLESPDPKHWLSMDESERLYQVEEFHRRAKLQIPGMMVHCAIHTTVENQIAMVEELPVKGKLEQLIQEGLDRHEAIHAIGSVLVEHIYNLLKEKTGIQDPNEEYYEELAHLTAEKWKSSFVDMDEI